MLRAIPELGPHLGMLASDTIAPSKPNNMNSDINWLRGVGIDLADRRQLANASTPIDPEVPPGVVPRECHTRAVAKDFHQPLVPLPGLSASRGSNGKGMP